MDSKMLEDFLKQNKFPQRLVNQINLISKNNKGKTLIYLAAQKGKWDLVEYLAQQIQAQYIENPSDKTGAGAALFYVIKRVTTKESQSKEHDKLLGRVINDLFEIKNMRLSYCILSGELKNYSILDLTIAYNNLKLTKQLIDYGFKIKRLFPSAMAIAMECKNWDALQLLINSGADYMLLLKSTKMRHLKTFIDDVMITSMSIFCSANNSHFQLNEDLRAQLKKSVLLSLLKNEEFTHTFVFKNSIENEPKKGLLIKGLSEYIATNVLKRYTTFFDFFNKNLWLNNPDIPQYVISQSINLELNTFLKPKPMRLLEDKKGPENTQKENLKSDLKNSVYDESYFYDGEEYYSERVPLIKK